MKDKENIKYCILFFNFMINVYMVFQFLFQILLFVLLSIVSKLNKYQNRIIRICFNNIKASDAVPKE